MSAINRRAESNFLVISNCFKKLAARFCSGINSGMAAKSIIKRTWFFVAVKSPTVAFITKVSASAPGSAGPAISRVAKRHVFSREKKDPFKEQHPTLRLEKLLKKDSIPYTRLTPLELLGATSFKNYVALSDERDVTHDILRYCSPVKTFVNSSGVFKMLINQKVKMEFLDSESPFSFESPSCTDAGSTLTKHFET